MTLAHIILGLLAVYVLIGLIFALAFVTVGAGRIDHGARTGTIGFRLLIFPGTAALWPLLASKWRAAARQEVHP